MVFESDEPQPHKPIAGTGVIDDEAERGPEDLIPLYDDASTLRPPAGNTTLNLE